MSMPFYVSPEQLMKDRADFARKGIARGRSVVVVQYADGLIFVAENQSPSLHKISEIYDRLAFAAVGRYNEFENLRIAGVRLADMRGYAYDRRDVTGRGLANAYAQTLGAIFSSGGEKPYEVEIIVAEVADRAEDDQIYRLTYDGSVADASGFSAMGGSAESINDYLRSHYTAGLDREAALRFAVEALGHDGPVPRQVPGDHLEVALLDRTRSRPRKFQRLPDSTLVPMFGSASVANGAPSPGEAAANGGPTSPEPTNGSASGAAPSDTPTEEADGSSADSGEPPPGSASGPDVVR